MDNITVYSNKNKMSREQFDEWFSLLEISFPTSERRSYRGHLEEFTSARFNSLCLRKEKLNGFINYWDFGEFVYIEHFAVQPELRGQGIGAAIIRELCSRAGGRTMVLEAEPYDSGELAKRRIAFYERQGFVVNEYEYIQPAIAKGEEPIPLIIMSSPRALSKTEYEAIRDAIYREVYDKRYFF